MTAPREPETAPRTAEEVLLNALEFQHPGENDVEGIDPFSAATRLAISRVKAMLPAIRAEAAAEAEGRLRDAENLGYREGRLAAWDELREWAEENHQVAERVLAAAPAPAASSEAGLDVAPHESFEKAVGLVLSEHTWLNDGKTQYDQRCACNLWHGSDWSNWRDHFVAVLVRRLAAPAPEPAP